MRYMQAPDIQRRPTREISKEELDKLLREAVPPTKERPTVEMPAVRRKREGESP